MASLDVVRLPALTPPELIGLQAHLLDAVAGGACEPVLLLYQLPGEAISIGRYHVYGGPPSRAGVAAYRRLTGGRIINAGAGWLGCSLILPSRNALQAAGTPRLKPDQVMNRCARGALAAMRALGVDCFYPGRDTITCDRRELAMCSFEETAADALLFELFIAFDQGLDSLPSLLEQFDPDGSLTCPISTIETATTLTRVLRRAVSFAELSERLEAGYRSTFGDGHRRDLTGEETAAAGGAGGPMARWLNDREPDPALNQAARAGMQLGFVEARLAADGDRIERIGLYGDFIANSPGLAQFEQSLTGKRLDLMTLSAAAMQTYADGSNFILGVGDLTNLARLILKAS